MFLVHNLGFLSACLSSDIQCIGYVLFPSHNARLLLRCRLCKIVPCLVLGGLVSSHQRPEPELLVVRFNGQFSWRAYDYVEIDFTGHAVKMVAFWTVFVWGFYPTVQSFGTTGMFHFFVNSSLAFSPNGASSLDPMYLHNTHPNSTASVSL